MTRFASFSWPVLCAHLGPTLPEISAGLPLHLCRQPHPVEWLDVELPEPLLHVWLGGETLVEVSASTGHRWRFRAQAGRIDLYPRGRYERIYIGPTPEPVVVLSVPHRWLASAERAGVLDVPRFQFHDRVLKRLIRAFVAHADRDRPLGPRYDRSVSTAIVERLLNKDASRGEPARAGAIPVGVLLCIQELLDEQLADPPDIEAIAELSSMSVARFLREFKAAFGLTPHQYVIERRIEQAKDMLLSRDEPLAAVGLSLGFASQSHFSTAFRSRTGTTPSEFRRRRRD